VNPIWIIFIHLDFLTNDAFFLLNILFSDIGRLDKFHQKLHIVFKILCAVKKILGITKASRGIDRATKSSKFLEDIDFRILKNFVL